MSRSEQKKHTNETLCERTLGRTKLTCLSSLIKIHFSLPHLKVAGDTLSSLLCIKLKRMQEVQRLISTGLRDIHNWIKDEHII